MIFNKFVNNITNYQEYNYQYIHQYPEISSARVVNGRLIQYSNEVYAFQQKNPFYVFGEQVLRPVIDAVWTLSSSFFNGVARGCSSIDNLVSRTINFIPIVKAASSKIEIEKEEINRTAMEESKKIANAVWSAIGVNPKSYQIALANCLLSDKISFEEGNELITKVSTFNSIITRINEYVSKKNNEFTRLNFDFENICESRKAINEALLEFATHLNGADINRNHKFWKEYQDLEFNQSKNELKLNGKPYNSNGSVKIKENCGITPIVMILVDLLEKKGFLLGIFDIRDPLNISYEQFKDLLSQEVIHNMSNFVNQLILDIDSSIKNMESTLASWIEDYQDESIKNLLQCIHAIYKQHAAIANKNNDITINLVKKDNSNRPLEWKIVKKGTFIDTQIFSFSMSGREKDLGKIQVTGI